MAAPTTREELAVLGELAGEVAHELRNALVVISVTTPLLRGAEGPQREAYIAKIERNARLAQGVIDAVMALARNDQLTGTSVAISDVLREARTEVKGSLTYRDDVPDGTAVRGSALLLSRMFRVLYDNAAEAGASAVETEARFDGAAVTIDVRDDGPGVPADRRSALFEPLATTKAHGTGLGLALARRVARAHGGDVTLSDSGPRKGACFRIVLRR